MTGIIPELNTSSTGFSSALAFDASKIEIAKSLFQGYVACGFSVSFRRWLGLYGPCWYQVLLSQLRHVVLYLTYNKGT